MKMLIDTSFIMSCVKNNIDMKAELMKFGKPELFVIDRVMQELEKLSGGNGKEASNARLSLDFIRNEKIRVIVTEGRHTDREIKETALKEGMTVCAVDYGLRRRMMEAGADVITVRQNRYCERESGKQ